MTTVRTWPSKQLVNILDPDPETIRIEDIAHHLSMQCRWNGAVSQFYSVAQHSLHVEQLVEMQVITSQEYLGQYDRVLRTALLHDAAEAYIGDIITPVKRELGDDIEMIEQRVWIAIANKFDLDSGAMYYDGVVSQCDTLSYKIEQKTLCWGAEDAPEYLDWLPQCELELTPEQARDRFIERYEELK